MTPTPTPTDAREAFNRSVAAAVNRHRLTAAGIVEHQLNVMEEILDGGCTLSCAGAGWAGREICTCRCKGRYHGALWLPAVKELVELP